MPHHEIGNAPGYNIEVEHTGFHGVLEAVLQEVSNSLQIPVRLSRTSGKDLAGNFQKGLLRHKENGTQIGVFGDIEIQGHLEWGSALCQEAGPGTYFPLWQKPCRSLVREKVAQGSTANKYSGRRQAAMRERLRQEAIWADAAGNAEEEADRCRENGECHPFAQDSPAFTGSILFPFDKMRFQDILPHFTHLQRRIVAMNAFLVVLVVREKY